MKLRTKFPKIAERLNAGIPLSKLSGDDFWQIENFLSGKELTDLFEPIYLEEMDASPENFLEKIEPFRQFVNRASLQYNIPVDMIVAILYLESKWHWNAVSRTGSLGICQIRDWIWVHSKDFPGAINPLNPEQAIDRGVAYHRYLASRYWTNWQPSRRSITMYNTGESNGLTGREYFSVLKERAQSNSQARAALNYYSKYEKALQKIEAANTKLLAQKGLQEG